VALAEQVDARTRNTLARLAGWRGPKGSNLRLPPLAAALPLSYARPGTISMSVAAGTTRSSGGTSPLPSELVTMGRWTSMQRELTVAPTRSFAFRKKPEYTVGQWARALRH